MTQDQSASTSSTTAPSPDTVRATPPSAAQAQEAEPSGSQRPMYLAEVQIENFRLFGVDSRKLVLPLGRGLSVLVGENDSGKTAVIDAIRLVMGTTSQEFYRVEESDFHVRDGDQAKEFSVRCRFADISEEIGAALLEHLSYEDGAPCLYVSLRASLNNKASFRRRISVEVRSGKEGNGPQLEAAARATLQATYLRPLRDAARELAAGRNSRLSQILQHTKELADHKDEHFDPAAFAEAVRKGEATTLPRHVVSVSGLADHLLKENDGVKKAQERLDSDYLSRLHLGEDAIGSRVSVSDATTADQRLRSVLEKLELRLALSTDGDGRLPHGLGYNNLLFMACELLLLGQERDTLPLLLIEEPEAHLHPQLQLRLIEFLQDQTSSAVERPVQVILTTHSPTLASKVKLEHLCILGSGAAFPLAEERTLLSRTDRRFLERFLDVTKANLFFARGVLIVEGDAEALLLPTLARMLGRDLTQYGVSVVNVGTRGLRRYARIFRRAQVQGKSMLGSIPIRVACLADRDVQPDCAKDALATPSQPEAGEPKKSSTTFESDLDSVAKRQAWIETRSRDDGELVRTFVSDHWTFEYDLAYAGMGQHVVKAIGLAKAEGREDRTGRSSRLAPNVARETAALWKLLSRTARHRDDREAYLAYRVYEPFLGTLSKPTVAQHLAELLEDTWRRATELKRKRLRRLIPKYIVDAIKFVTSVPESDSQASPSTGAEA